MLYQLTDAAARSEASSDIIRYKMCLLSFTSTDWVYIKNIEQINPQDVKSALQHIYLCWKKAWVIIIDAVYTKNPKHINKIRE